MRGIKRLSTILFAGLLLVTVGCASVPSKGPAVKIPRHDRIVAVGDVHGHYDGLVKILKETSLIDDRYRWIGGNALLVQTGDILDRGPDVRQIMDLLTALQGQAPSTGGRVVVLLGNHEAMNLMCDSEYVRPEALKSFATRDSEEKQKEAYDKWSRLFDIPGQPDEEKLAREEKWMADHPPGFVEHNEALGPEGQYGRWMRSLPTIFKYGATIFVHAGISPYYAESSIQTINESIAADISELDSIKSYLMKMGFVQPFFTFSEMISVVSAILEAGEKGLLPEWITPEIPRLTEIETFLVTFYDTSPVAREDGPLWFRGFDQLPEEEFVSYLPGWLQKNKAWRVIVSHCPQADGLIQSRLDGSIFLIDTGMFSEYFKGGQASALEIKDDDVCAVYEAGDRYSFPAPKIDYGPEHVWTGPDATPLPFDTVDKIEQFLLTASPVSTEVIDTGVNRPHKLILEKDAVRINAIFRHQTETEDQNTIPGSLTKTRYFRDSYNSEIAAYEMNRILGLNNIPPTVSRTIDGRQGTLQLWAEQTMMEYNIAPEDILPPELAALWNRQKGDMRVFDNLINNTDRNKTNILFDINGRLILIDHTRSFARDQTLPHPERVVHCSRGLWHALRHLDESEVRKRLTPYLKSSEIDALFDRRQLLVKLIKDLIARDGEENVLF
jgi:hypothetical protein